VTVAVPSAAVATVVCATQAAEPGARFCTMSWRGAPTDVTVTGVLTLVPGRAVTGVEVDVTTDVALGRAVVVVASSGRDAASMTRTRTS
jgi:hypothetical protein